MYNYVSFGISLIFVVMGILILSNILDSKIYFGGNNLIRYIFGGMLVVYGIFRAYNSYLKITAKPKKFHYWNPGDDNE